MYKTQKVQKCYLKCSIYKIGGATAVFLLLVLQIIQTSGPPDTKQVSETALYYCHTATDS